MQELRDKQLEKESKLDGLDKFNVINWERSNMIQAVYKLDEKQFQDRMSDILQAQKAVNKRQQIIQTVSDVADANIASNITENDGSLFHQSDQKHFDAIFAKPKQTQE